MFGTCKKCGKPAIGSYYGGTPGLCYDHFEQSKKDFAEKGKIEAQNKLVAEAKALAERLKISIEAAILILKK